ncbi:MAG: alpha/beta hydrolase [Acidobacteriota bacterium]|nr:alpha/beta hydrolase [Blastocatellia bacterium]MDW8412105.1 alpha/beta hydrolase [Acidobacteriota bacterium]
MPFLQLDEANLFYREFGQGRSVVFVNGWTSSFEYWLPLVDQLKSSFRCIVYDMRGFGSSQPTNNAIFDLDQYADDLHRLIESLDAPDACLVAHGMGAWVAVVTARLHPQDLSRLTLISPELATASDVWQQASLVFKDLASVPLLRNLVVRRFRHSPEPFKSRLFEDFARADRRAAFQLLASCAENELSGRLKKALSEITAPVMIVRGTNDKLCSKEQAQTLFETIRVGKLVTIKGCHHLPMLEFTKPLAELLTAFFQINKPNTRA